MIAAGITIGMYSVLYKDNILFKAVEHIFIGVSGGYMLFLQWHNVFWPEIIQKIFVPDPGDPHDFWRIIPLVLGILMVLRVSKKIGWISRYTFAWVMGVSAGLAIPKYMESIIIKQTRYTVQNPFVGDTFDIAFAGIFLGLLVSYIVLEWLVFSTSRKSWLRWVLIVPLTGMTYYGTIVGMISLSNIIVLVGVLSVLVYFFFSIEHKGPIAPVSKMGIYFLMISFGASFGYTIMARMSLFIGRLEFLLQDWLGVLSSH